MLLEQEPLRGDYQVRIPYAHPVEVGERFARVKVGGVATCLLLVDAFQVGEVDVQAAL